MNDLFNRTEQLIGKESMSILSNSKVLLFGVGGVGGFVAEALVRSGLGSLTVVDNDTVCESNINRQIISNVNNIGRRKTDVIKERLTSINPNLNFMAIDVFYLPENSNEVDFSSYDYVIDAIDTVSAKIEIIRNSKKFNVPVISCMGTGGKINPQDLKVDDISKSEGCPLARVVRRELRRLDVKNVKVVYSKEQVQNDNKNEKKADGKTAPPSMIFVPACAGLIIAKEVVFDLINMRGPKK